MQVYTTQSAQLANVFDLQRTRSSLLDWDALEEMETEPDKASEVEKAATA